MNLLKMRAKLVKAKNEVEQQTAKIIDKNQQQIYDFVRKDQLFEKGENAEGQIIGRYARTYDAQDHFNTGISPDPIGFIKHQGEPYNFYWTNHTYRSWLHNYSNFKLDIFPTDKKSEILIGEYGESIFFANTQHKEDINFKIIAPQLQIWFKGILKS